MRELAGWLVATSIALLTAAIVVSSSRAELLLRDGDSLIVALFVRSALSGEPLDWAMSSVLFVPESAAFVTLDATLPLSTNGLLLASAVLNLLALYGAIRLAAGRQRDDAATVAWSLIALATFGLLATTESSASRDALELASLQLTTTYYSATVVAVVLAAGLVRRMLERQTRGILLPVALAAVAAVSTLSNPLFAVWATVPLAAVLVVGALRGSMRGRLLLAASALVGGTAAGFLLRIPFSAWIANTGADYAQPSQWRESLGYYGQLLADRVQTPGGAVAVTVTVALLVLAVVLSVRSREPGTRFIATSAWAMPAVVVIGAILLGTHAARYLQPVAFAPVLALVAAPRIVRLPTGVRRAGLAAVGALALVAGALSVPVLVRAAEDPDPDLACVTSWTDESGRTGAGQFWTVRLPKLHADDPARLVQVDHRLNGYAWLVNRTDFAVGEVTFLIEDAQTVPWDLPVTREPDAVIDCGRYSILDFGSDALPLGPAHS